MKISHHIFSHLTQIQCNAIETKKLINQFLVPCSLLFYIQFHALAFHLKYKEIKRTQRGRERESEIETVINYPAIKTA